jgi:hypothetical protein
MLVDPGAIDVEVRGDRRRVDQGRSATKRHRAIRLMWAREPPARRRYTLLSGTNGGKGRTAVPNDLFQRPAGW